MFKEILYYANDQNAKQDQFKFIESLILTALQYFFFNIILAFEGESY